MITRVSGISICPDCKSQIRNQPSFGSIMPIEVLNKSTGELIQVTDPLIKELTKCLKNNRYRNIFYSMLRKADPHGFAKEPKNAKSETFAFHEIFGKWCIFTGKDLAMIKRDMPIKVFTDYFGEIRMKNHTPRKLVVKASQLPDDTFIPERIYSKKMNSTNDLLDLIKEN